MLERHAKAARALTEIEKESLRYIREREHVSEFEVRSFIENEFRKRDLRKDSRFRIPIVGFGAHSAIPHYFPGTRSARLKNNSLVLIDIWAGFRGLHSPLADITWVAWRGRKIPARVKRVFHTVLRARDTCARFIEESFRNGRPPSGMEAHESACAEIIRAGYGKNILHGTGHVLGLSSAHGRGGAISKRNPNSLKQMLGYTIEPGIYLKGVFGIRSEINFYISKKNKLVVTPPPQKDLIRV